MGRERTKKGKKMERREEERKERREVGRMKEGQVVGKVGISHLSNYI